MDNRNYKKNNGFKKPLSKYEEYKKKDFSKKNELLEERKSHFFELDKEEVKEERKKIWRVDNPDFLLDEGIEVILECTSLSYEAKGICKVNCFTKKGMELVNYPIFVDGLLPLETGVVLIDKIKTSFAEGTLVSIKKRNPLLRTEPICPNYSSCGGCDLMHMTYDAEINYKKEALRETLEHIGGFNDLEINDCVRMDNPIKYRNKVQIPYCFNNFKTECGFYKKKTHSIVNMNECYIQSDLASDIAKFVRNLANEFKIKGFNERLNEGELKHIVIRENKDQSEVMVIIVTKSVKVPCLDLMVNKIVNRYKNVTSVIQNINPLNVNTVLGDKNITLYGNDKIIDELLGVKFSISPLSFYQVNTKQTELLYDIAIKEANLNKEDVLIDAFCGIGTIGLISSKFVKEVYGVEIVNDAILNAIENSKLNGIDNCHFVSNKAETQIVKWMEEGIKPTVIIVDPPRKGIEEEFLKTVVLLKIKKMVYVSCNPATLARDLRYLCDNGYMIKSVTPVDMFPHTKHVETVVALSFKK